MKPAVVLCAAACVVLLGNVNCSSVPFITRCHAADRVCLKSAAQRAVPAIAAGVPALGLQTLDPMRVEHVAAKQAGLDVEFTDTEVRGLRHCVVLDFQRKGPQMSMDLQCSVVLLGNYKLNGKLLFFPIHGSGLYKITIRDIVVKVTMDTGVRSEGGEKYWTVRSWRYTADVLTSVNFHFQNLFNGDDTMAKTVSRFANSNWRDIFHEVSPPIVKAIVAKIVHETSKLFEKVPIRELSLD